MEEIIIDDKIEAYNNQLLVEEQPISVYVKVNEEGFITDVNSDIFIKDFTGWQKIDKGYGDRYAHAQNLYFDKSLINNQGDFYLRIDKKAEN